MEFGLSETQSLLQASLRRAVADAGRASMATAWTGEARALLAALGIQAATLPEAHGGMGGGSQESMVILAELGRGHGATPYVESAVTGGGLVARLGTPAQQQSILPRLAAGGLVLAFADGAADPDTVELRPREDGFRLDGRVRLVPFAPVADAVLVACREPAGGETVVILDRARLEPALTPVTTIDGRPAASIRFDGMAVSAADLLGPPGEAGRALAAVRDAATAALCAEATGIMAGLIAATVEHLNTRTQFGAPLAGFQSLQHRVADLFLAWQLAVSLTCKAAIRCGDADPGPRGLAVSAAKVEPLKAMEPQYGSIRHHLDRYRALRRGTEP
jgi:pimeloyl-CoA dehydrogenase